MVDNAQQGEVVFSPRRRMHQEEQLLQEKVGLPNSLSFLQWPP